MRRGVSEKLQAWVATGPLGHLWSFVADVAVFWTRYLVHRVRRR